MKEPMVKLTLALVALSAIALGLLFVVAPHAYLEYLVTEPVNVGWLRTLGAGLIGLQGFGLLITAFRRRDTNPGLLLVAFVSTLQTGTAWYSMLSDELPAETGWAVVVPIALATVGSLLLWMVWFARHASRSALGQPRGRVLETGAEPHGDFADSRTAHPADVPLNQSVE